jgi:hypothetical protein
MNWAYQKDESELQFKKHSRDTRGYFAIAVINDGSVIEYSQEIVERNPFLVHGFIAWSAWCILALVQLASARYLKVFWKLN